MPAEILPPPPQRRHSRLGGRRSRFRRGPFRLGRAHALRPTKPPWPLCWPLRAPRTPENSLRLYDAAIEQLSLAGAQAGVLNSVAADKAVRDQAQLEAQRVAMAGSALSLNRAVYEALAAIDLTAPVPPQSTLLSAPCSATAWPAWTRTRPPATICSRCTRRPPASRSNSAATFRRAARPSRPRRPNWTGLPADYLARHQPDADGRVTLYHRPARHAAGHDLCRQPCAARAHVPGLQHARLSGQPADPA